MGLISGEIAPTLARIDSILSGNISIRGGIQSITAGIDPILQGIILIHGRRDMILKK